ncbi:Lysophosphatidic acid phosphatase type 6 [Blyttiomyces sp. JEL0837]|nr:Lysophosphatidic acid phosphatase type 6 [Blyttiomyces sp. JEL0837]
MPCAPSSSSSPVGDLNEGGSGSNEQRCVSDELADGAFRLGGWWIRNEYGLTGAIEDVRANHKILSDRKELVKLRVGPLLKEFVGYVDDAVRSYLGRNEDRSQNQQQDQRGQDASSKRVYIYSAHDTTISGLLGAFGNVDRRWPPYASSIVVEVWVVDEDKIRIRMVYNGRNFLIPVCLNNGGDSGDANVDGGCDFAVWRDGIGRLVPVDLEAECQYVMD